MDWITDNLAVASAQRARETGDKFDRVVSMACSNEHTTHEYLIDDGEHEYDTFKNAVECVIQGLDNDEQVLVHCMAGISRSVSVCIAVCTVYKGMDYQDAYNTCQRGFQHPSADLLDSVRKYIEEKEN